MIIELLSLAPPYSPECTVTRALDIAPSLPPGTLLLVRVLDAGSADDSRMETELRRLRAWAPHCPMAVWLSLPDPSDSYPFVRKAWSAGARAVVVGATPTAKSLRAQLTDVTGLGYQVGLWISQITNAEKDVASGIERVLDDVTFFGRDRFEHDRMRAPRSWLHLARALHACLRLQRYPNLSISSVALEAGYADASTFSRQCVDLFGARPTAIRNWLGWEPLLAQWHTCRN